MVLEFIETESQEDFKINFEVQIDGIKKVPLIKLDLQETLSLEKILDAYFEKPFFDVYFQDIDEDDLKSIEFQLNEYGLTLFKTLVIATGLESLYRHALKKKLEIRITGNSTKFHSVYWEALIDTELQVPVVSLGVTILRVGSISIPKMQPIIRLKSLRILIVTARPDEEKDINYRTIQRPIVEAFRDNPQVEITILRPGTFEALIKLLGQYGPGHFDLIHLDLHGGLLTYSNYNNIVSSLKNVHHHIPVCLPFEEERPFIYFESNIKGASVPIEALELSKQLRKHQIHVCILNACKTAKSSNGYEESGFGQALSAHGIPYVLAMRHSLSAAAAKLFMEAFYRELSFGKNLSEANMLAVQELEKNSFRLFTADKKLSLKDWILPVQFAQYGFDFRLNPELLHDKSAPALLNSPTLFFGRDLDILRLERKFLLNEKVILVGPIGIGKTSLVKYLLDWWRETGFIERGIYVDISGITLFKEFLLKIDAVLLLEFGTVYEKIACEGTLQTRILRMLENHNILIIIDHFENLFIDLIQTSAFIEELKEIRSFLNTINGGYLLICSTFVDQEEKTNYSSYVLEALDREAVTELIDHYKIPDNTNQSIRSHNFHLNTLLELSSGHPGMLSIIGLLLRSYNSEKVLRYFWGMEVLPVSEGLTDHFLVFNKIWEKAPQTFQHIWSSLTYVQLFIIQPSAEILKDLAIKLDVFYGGLKDDPFSPDDILELLEFSVRKGLFIRNGWNYIQTFVNPEFSFFLRKRAIESAQDLQLRQNFSAYFYFLSLRYLKLLNNFGSFNKQNSFLEIHNLKFAALELLERGVSYWPPFSLASEYYQSQSDAVSEVTFANELIEKHLMQVPDIQKKLVQDQFYVLSRLATRLEYLGKANEAGRIRFILKSIDLSEKHTPNDLALTQFDMYINEAIALKKQENWDMAIELYNKAIEIATQIEGTKELTSQMLRLAYYNLSILYRDQKNDLDKAIELGLLAISKAYENNQPRELLESILNTGAIYAKKKEYDRAIFTYEQALQIAESLNTPIFNREVGWSLFYIGGIYFETKNYYAAIQKFEKSLGIATTIQDTDLQSRLKECLGDCFIALGEINTGVRILLDAAQDYLRINLLSSAGVVYFKLAKEFDKLGWQNPTIDMIKRTMGIFFKLGNVFALQEIYDFVAEKNFLPPELLNQEGQFEALVQVSNKNSHYFFAHVALPTRIHKDMDSLKLWETLILENPDPLIDIWQSTPKELLEQGIIPYSGLALKRIQLQTGHDSVLIKLPNPEFSPGASYILIVLIKQAVSHPNPAFRYFTLEKDPLGKFTLCEWNSELKHINCRQEVENDPSAFIEACTRVILKN